MALNCSQFSEQAKVQKCNELNQLISQYKVDMTALQKNNESNLFTNLMKLNQYRDNNWQHNYNVGTKRGEVNKITRNLNAIVSGLTGDYNETSQIVNDRAQTIKGYDELAKFQEEDLARMERRADAASDRLTLRNRMVLINNAAARSKTKLIYLLKIFFTLVVFMIPAFVAYLAGSLSIQGFFGIFFVLMLVYIIYVVIELYYTGDSNLKQQVEKDIHKFNKRFYRFGRKANRAFDNYIKAKCSECAANGPGYVPVQPRFS